MNYGYKTSKKILVTEQPKYFRLSIGRLCVAIGHYVEAWEALYIIKIKRRDIDMMPVCQGTSNHSLLR